jgi:ligand-binding sensor domain-containing protein/class 3 adenylate cyclase/predicted metal-dependent HD superfamily phosphohydrolase
MIRITQILLFLIWSFVTFGQSVYRFRNYTINDGLSQSSVSCIVQDDNNSLWIGTQDGLNRFDGKSFEVFTSDDTEGLESEYIKASFKASDGKLWFGTTNGLTVYNPANEQFTTYSQKGKTALSIESISQDQNGFIWLGTTNKGLLTFDTLKKSFTSYSHLLESKKILLLNVSEDNTVFVNTEDKGLYVINSSRTVAEKVLFPTQAAGEMNILRIVQWNRENVLFGTNQGIFQYSTQTKTVRAAFPGLNERYGVLSVSDIYRSTNEYWYIGTTNAGLITITPDGRYYNSVQDMFQKHALLFNDINLLFRDATGTFWIGTERGLSSFNPSRQGILGIGPSANLTQGIPNPNVWSFAEDAEGSGVYIGTDVGVSRFDRATGRFDQYYRTTAQASSSEVIETVIHSIEVIDKNKMFVGCSDGLFELNVYGPNSYTYSQIPFLKNEEFIRQKRVYTILKWKENEYFLGTKAGVFYFNLKTKKTQVFEHDFKAPDKTITAGACRVIFKDSQGRVWFATSSGELSQLKTSGGELKIVPYQHNSKLLKNSKDYISSICQTGPNEFWMGTFGSGLIHINHKTGKARFYTKRDGLPNNVVYSVLKDKSGKLWMSTNKGLSCFDPRTGNFSNFTEKDGLMSNEFNLGAYLNSKSGELYFGGIYGYNYFDPLELSTYSRKIDVFITKFKFDKSWLRPGEKGSPLKLPISVSSGIELTYRQRSFTIRFQPSDISNPDQVNYKYRLEGSDEGELFLGSTNEIRFNALSSGEYVLYVYARLGEGPWGQPAKLTILIKPSYWASWWFITLSIIVGTGLIIWIVRKRVEYERREQVKLEMKIADRTREIRLQNEKIESQKKQLEEEKTKVEEQQRLLQIEKDKSEKLLKNIIPEETVEELKNKGKASARAYKVVSVLFTDFVGFTKIAEHMNPSELVEKLDVYFRKFDEIIVKNSLEKIKTIGDAYMCAGGVPVRNGTNPIDTCLAALQIQDYMRKLKNDAIINNTDYWELRLGINTGEVTAGVIGSQKLAYDIWGSTVNQAQRMEMLGEPGKVTISGNTFLHVEPYFECVFRGKVQSKGKGLIDMYTVERIKPELSVDGEGIYPNDRFKKIVELHHYSSINYYKAERHIMRVLEKGLSDKLHYHSISHTRDVVKAVERIALMEGVTDEGLFLLKSAATYHDAGFVEQYDKNEPVGARMAEEILPKYGYTEQHIAKIKELIFVTQIPHQPKNKLEEIMCDADLDYLGREDFHEIADKLRRELRDHGKISSDRKWDEIQIVFLEQHKYFTETSIKTRQDKKLKNLEEVRLRLEKNQYID